MIRKRLAAYVVTSEVHSAPPQHVTCHVSHVMCHMSHVACHVSIYLFIYFFGQKGGAYCWRVCYQRGLPRLVFIVKVR